VPIGVREFLTEESAKVELVEIIPKIASNISPSNSVRNTDAQAPGKGIGI
jgi:hypothetical protein